MIDMKLKKVYNELAFENARFETVIQIWMNQILQKRVMIWNIVDYK